MSDYEFGTVICCIDGRVQIPVNKFMREKYGLDCVDTVTFPGADLTVARNSHKDVKYIRGAVHLSSIVHNSKIVAIVGHHGCAAYPVSEDVHRLRIQEAIKVIKSWHLGVEVVGLWVDSNWEAHEITEIIST